MIVATVLIQRSDGRILVVWNRKLRGWTLPGGKREPGEGAIATAARELLEETGMVLPLHVLRLVYAAKPPASEGPGAPKEVCVFEIDPAQRCEILDQWAIASAREMEPGCPVSWFTREDFLASSPVREFYEGCFSAIGGAR